MEEGDDHTSYGQENMAAEGDQYGTHTMLSDDQLSRPHSLVAFSKTHSKEEKKANAQV